MRQVYIYFYFYPVRRSITAFLLKIISNEPPAVNNWAATLRSLTIPVLDVFIPVKKHIKLYIYSQGLTTLNKQKSREVSTNDGIITQNILNAAVPASSETK